jgi:hypothetical protein
MQIRPGAQESEIRGKSPTAEAIAVDPVTEGCLQSPEKCRFAKTPIDPRRTVLDLFAQQ